MKVLVACESSERVKKAFMDRGHEAHSCDIKPGEQGLPNHHQCDILWLLQKYKGYFDMMIAFPDCTYPCNSGVRWLHERPMRWFDLCKAIKFFNELLDADIPLKALENPIMHKYARQYIRTYDQIIQPWNFGDNETKATCLWLVGVPPLIKQVEIKPDNIKQSVWREAPNPNRKENRSRTFLGIADAMAEQWGHKALYNVEVELE